MALLKSGTRIYGNATIDTQLAIDGSNSATSANTGALVLSNGGLGVHGNIYSGAGLFATDATISGNLTVGGNIAYINVTNSYLTDALIELGGNSNGGALTSDDNKDRGTLLHYHDGNTAVDAFMGWDNSNNEFGFGSNVTVANNVVTINQYGNVRADRYYGNGSSLTGVVADTLGGPIANLTVSGNINFAGTSNILLGNVSNINLGGGTVGQFLRTDGNGNIAFASVQSLVKSNITNIVAGSAIDITVDMGNLTYPGGIFTLEQLGPISLSATNQWNQSGANIGTSKNAYANFIANTVNTSNIKITLNLANATFNINAQSDSITFGSSTITGANLTALGITGTGGTYTVPSTYLTSSSTQTNTSVPTSVSLTTNRNIQTGSGTTLTNNQPVPFNVTALSGTFPASTVPYWSLNQTFNWNATTTAGATVASGNVAYANTANSVSGSLTSVGATSGTSVSLDSTLTYTLTSNDYFGAGQFGAGSRTMTTTVNGTVNPATKYYPLFWKTTANSTIPTFTTSDSRNSNNFAVGQSANTTAISTDFLWLATPTNVAHTFKHIFLGSDIVDTPDASANITISEQTYRVWGFTNFSAITAIIVTS
jgi:hypothetical protein